MRALMVSMRIVLRVIQGKFEVEGGLRVTYLCIMHMQAQRPFRAQQYRYSHATS